MVDHVDLYSSFDNKIFHCACTDALRIVSILSLESLDVTRPTKNKPTRITMYERTIFLSRFFFMVFIKGFTPPIFDILPFNLWRLLSLLIYIYRLYLVPYWLRLSGYIKFANWDNIGTLMSSLEVEDKAVLKIPSLSKETKLSELNFGDEKYQDFVSALIRMSTHLMPHSQSPGNPITHDGFPGNFFDHLVGVYKILAAWRQPRFVVRAGMFHSVYGTFDYRYSLFDLRNGRQSLTDLIGPASEELAFAICTSDRIGMLMQLMRAMYGKAFQPSLSNIGKKVTEACDDSPEDVDGNPLPPLIGSLTKDGFPVTNHITQKVHVFSAEFFAQFVIVMIADFLEQGALVVGSADLDICLFQFIRFRMYNDLIRFVKPFLKEEPFVWNKYLGDKPFIEPQRHEILNFKRVWLNCIQSFEARQQMNFKTIHLVVSPADKQLLVDMVRKYPYIPEPAIALAFVLKHGEIAEGGVSREVLARRGLLLLEEWGMLILKSSSKSGNFSLKQVLHLVQSLIDA